MAAADVAPRVSAAAVDFILLGFVGLGLTMLAGVPSLVSSLAVTALMLLVGVGYFVGSWSTVRGATPGMRFFRLTVRDVTNGGPITREAAFRRWLVLGAPMAFQFFYGWGIGQYVTLILAAYYGYLLFTVWRSPTGRGLHDEFAATIVAKT